MIYPELNKTNRVILEEFNKRVEGHIEAKKALINLVNRSKIRHNQKWIKCLHNGALIEPSNILLIGGSGTGKTHLVESLQQIVQFPLIKVDASKFCPTTGANGINGTDLENMIRDEAVRLAKSAKHPYYTQQGAIDQMIVFVDELDKLGDTYEGSGGWNKRTQSGFLTLFENYEEFSGVSFIFAGAFVGMEEETTRKSIGFHAGTTIKKDKLANGLDEAVVKYGIMPELVGRINHIVKLDKFSRDEFRKILLERIIPAKRNELIHFNFADFELTEQQIIAILDSAEKSGQGVRYLKRALNDYIRDIEFHYEEQYNKQRYISFDGNIYEGLENKEE